MLYQHFQSLNLYYSAWQKPTDKSVLNLSFWFKCQKNTELIYWAKISRRRQKMLEVLSLILHTHLTMLFSTKLPKSKFRLHTLFRCFTAQLLSALIVVWVSAFHSAFWVQMDTFAAWNIVSLSLRFIRLTLIDIRFAFSFSMCSYASLWYARSCSLLTMPSFKTYSKLVLIVV